MKQQMLEAEVKELKDRIEALTAERDVLKMLKPMLEKMIWQADVRGDYWRASAEAAEADNERLTKGCERAMSEIRDYMQEIGSTLPLELAMGWLSAALNAGKETK
jgi:hypothetical protein